jgi:hypothetical protein
LFLGKQKIDEIIERIFEDLLIKLFNKSIEGLNETFDEMNSLQRRH